MIKQLTAIAFLILMAAGAAFSQSVEQQAGRIRAAYAETNRRIEAGLKDKTSGLHYAAWTIGGTSDGQQWSAVGTMKSTDEFWFEGEPGAGEEAVDARRLVRKIVSMYAGAADLRVRSEYLFNDQGEMVFAFTSELEADGKTIERRFYYAKGKLIRTVRGGRNTDAKFSAEDLEKAGNASEAANDLRNKFAIMFAE